MYEMDPKLNQPLNGHSFHLWSTFVIAFPLHRTNSGSKIWRNGSGPIPQVGAKSIYWRSFIQVPSPHYWAFPLRSSQLNPRILSLMKRFFKLGLLKTNQHRGTLGGKMQKFLSLSVMGAAYSKPTTCLLISWKSFCIFYLSRY